MKRQVGGVQRMRSARPTTIHDCALSGDLISLQKLLKDNPSLLNERNPVVRFCVSESKDPIFWFSLNPILLCVADVPHATSCFCW